MIETFPAQPADPGVIRQVLSHSPELMMVSFRFEKDAAGKLHNHPHIQSTYVKSGEFIFLIDGEEVPVKEGDSFVIPSNAVHGCICIAPGELIDTFTPRRDDFL